MSVLALVICLAGCETCVNEVYSQVQSPDGDKIAVLYERGCGATVEFNSQLSILPANDQVPTDSGNVAIFSGRKSIAVEWVSDTELRIHAASGERSFKSVKKFLEVDVLYE